MCSYVRENEDNAEKEVTLKSIVDWSCNQRVEDGTLSSEEAM